MVFKAVQTLYSRGDIINLKVEKKLPQANLVIFDLASVPACLHISEISNNPELSQKLLHIIEVGEMITVVITGFNSEKEYVELSLRPLRNQLEGSLSFAKCKNIIEQTHSETLDRLPRFLKQDRNILNRLQGDLAKVDLTFLYELIQNAVDHPNPSFNNQLSIKFEVLNDYLLLKHNGSIFTENNFRSLTGIMLGEEDTGEERIGYKGIGFKSIFKYTQEVYIRSGNFSFSFSKERSGANNPWEVIPIFENEIEKVDEIKDFEFFNTPVAFAFKFTNPELKEQAITYLEQLVAIPEVLLFLDKLKSIEIVVDGNIKKINREATIYDTYEKIHLQLNEGAPQEWLVCKEKSIITDNEILNELKDKNNLSIPLKFRDFNSPEVQIAFPLKERENLINLYTHLPLSETVCNLPYIVNGDFIPNLDRTELIKNLKYNNSLSKLAASALAKLFKVVTSEYGIDKALTLIPQFDSNTTDFFNKLNEAFIDKQNELTIVLPSKREVPLKDYVVDTSGLFSILDKKEIQKHELFRDNYVFDKINTTTEEQLQEKLGVKSFTIQEGLELLVLPEIADKYYPDFPSLALLLVRLSRLPNAAEWTNGVSSLHLVKQEEIFLPLNKLYSNTPEGFEEMFKQILNIHSLGRNDYDLLKKHPRVAHIIEQFGLKQFKINEALRQLDHKSEELKNVAQKELLNQVWHFLYLNRDLKNKDRNLLVNERFKQLPINTIDGKVEVLENCFAGDTGNTGNDFSFLHEAYGKEQLAKVNISELAKEIQVDETEVISFLSSIHNNVELTDKLLFKRALKIICGLPKEELLKNKESLIKALLSVFSFHIANPDEPLLQSGMFHFPVLTTTNEIEQISSTYFDKSYSSYFNEDELFAEKLFKNIEGISFISKEYLNHISDENKPKFVQFLKDNFVSAGLKYFNSNLFLKNSRVNLAEIEEVYKGYNNGYSNFKTTNEFYIFKDITKLNGLYDNLLVFWTELAKVKPQNLFVQEIYCNGNYLRPNPLIWLLRGNKMFPMQGGEVKSRADISSEKLLPFLLDPNDRLAACFDSGLDSIVKMVDFKSTLNIRVIINCLQNLSQLSEDNRRVLMLEHFSKTHFTSEELQQNKNNIYLVAKDKSVQPVSALLYIDKTLDNTSLAMEQTTFPNCKILENYDYNINFKRNISKLGIPIKSDMHIELRNYDPNTDFNIQEFSTKISDFGSNNLTQNYQINLLSQSKYIACNRLNIGLINTPEFQADVDSYYDSKSKTFYFTEVRDLIDLLCDKFNWPIAKNKRLRKLLEKDKSREPKKQVVRESTRFSEEELIQIKSLFGRELPDDELQEENLYAQIKALRYFKDKDYDVSGAEDNFENKFDDKYLSPVIDESGNSYKVLCRSARRGVLFLGAYAWNLLEDANTLLYILTGDNSVDCMLINSQEELESKLNAEFKVLRRKNTTYEELRNLIGAEKDLSDLQLLYKVKGSSFDVIFNPQRNQDVNTEGPLVDIGIDV